MNFCIHVRWVYKGIFYVAAVTTSNTNLCLSSLPKADTKILISTARIFLRVLVRSVLLERFSQHF